MTLVQVWCRLLWLFFQSLLGVALSHSYVVEWIVGSRIQSHWPCMTLCPISMFSRTLETLSIAVPANHAGGNSEANSAARPPVSRTFWALMTLRM